MFPSEHIRKSILNFFTFGPGRSPQAEAERFVKTHSVPEGIKERCPQMAALMEAVVAFEASEIRAGNASFDKAAKWTRTALIAYATDPELRADLVHAYNIDPTIPACGTVDKGLVQEA